MRDSGVDYLGEIPAEWGVDAFSQLFSQRNEKVSDTDYAPLSVTMKGVVPQLETVAKSDDHSNRKLVRKGDFAINSRSDRRNSCGFAMQDGSVSLINTICVPRVPMESRYFGYLFATSQWADEFYSYGHGIVADLWTTGWSDMKRIPVPLPPQPEQRRIAGWLDERCASIDAAIEAARASIDEYEAYKKSVISHAVTRGLDPDAPLKDTGIPWLGQVPEGWEVHRMRKFVTYERGVQVTKAQLQDSGKAIINYGQIHSKANSGVRLHRELIRYAPADLLEDRARLKRNDLLFATTSEDRESLGKAVFFDSDEEVYAGSDSVICRLQGAGFQKYFAYQFLTDAWRDQLRCVTNGIKVFHVTQTRLNTVDVLVPSLPEQRAIAAYLDSRTAAIDAVVAQKRAILEDLLAYKKSLIYEAVTGKREV